MAASTDTATTTIAPVAIERIVAVSIRNRPARATTTVAPLNATAIPDVRIAVRRASARDAPAAISSR